jgi:hypothetical protein
VAGLPLLLVGMKRGPFSFHPFDQFPDTIKHSLIHDPERHALVMLDLAVEFDALVTHLLTGTFVSAEATGHLSK